MIENRNMLIVISLFVILTALHVMAFWNQTSTDVFPDEASYLMQARHFAGKDPQLDKIYFLKHYSYLADSGELPSIEGWPYYHFGYSLLVSPIYWLIESPADTYRGIIVFNSLMLSSLFLIIFAWLRTIGSVNPTTAITIAFVTSLYPPYILQAHIGWAENAFIPAFALSCMLYSYYLKNRNTITLLLFALVAGYLYTIHPRGLAVAVGAIISLLVLLSIYKERRWVPIVGIMVILAVLFGTKSIASELANMMEAHSQGGRILQKLSLMGNLVLFPAICGQFLYMILASVGLFALGVMEATRYLLAARYQSIQNMVSNPASGSILYVTLASALTFGASVLFLSRTAEWHNVNKSIDYFMYGRYNEGYLSIYIALGLLWLHKASKLDLQRYSLRLNSGFWVLTACAIAYSWFLADFTGLRSIHTYGLFSWYFLSLGATGWLGVAPIIIAPLVWTWLILQIFFRSETKGMFIIGCYFLLLSLSLIIYITPGIQFSS